MLYFLLYKLLNMFRATMCPSSGADDWLVVFATCWYWAVAAVSLSKPVGSYCVHWGVRSSVSCATNPSMDTIATNRSDNLTAATAQYQHVAKTTNQSSAPDDGHMVARNMLSNL